MTKIALVSGASGQDGSFLCELLLSKGYVVHCIIRRSATPNTQNIIHILHRITLHYGDVTDAARIIEIVQQVQPDEIYNLAAMSDVKISFDNSKYTMDTNAGGCLNFLEAIRILNLKDKTRFYQAGTSEMFGKTTTSIQNENTPFHPQSPYAVAKVAAHYYVKMYRQAYGIFACNGILHNHESPRRGENFVTRKITKAIASGNLPVVLGNLDSVRDWGFSGDFVEGMYRILQQEKPDDFVLATGQTHTVRDFLSEACAQAGYLLRWFGSGLDEIGVDVKTGKTLVTVSSEFYRPAEVSYLCGDYSKAKRVLGWSPKVNLRQLVALMLHCDIPHPK